jgi:hypothetical protein
MSNPDKSALAFTDSPRMPSLPSSSVVSPFGSKTATFALNAAATGRAITSNVKVSCCVSPLLNFEVAASSYLPGTNDAGKSKRRGMRSCWPVATVICLLPLTRPGRASDHSLLDVTVSRELLMTMICFSTVSPGKNVWSLLVNAAGFPPM